MGTSPYPLLTLKASPSFLGKGGGGVGLRPGRATCLALALLLLAACARGTPAAAPAATSTARIPATSAAEPAASPLPTAIPASPPAANGWTVEIVQNGQAASTDTGQVLLARAPFTLRVSLPQPLPVKLNANADDANFLSLQPGFVFTEDCLQALCTGMDVAEERLNPAQALFVDPMSTHYLYYQGPEDHRWSRATVDANGAVFERDVALLNDQPIAQYAAPALYLLFFVDFSNPGVIDEGELKKIALIFS